MILTIYLIFKYSTGEYAVNSLETKTFHSNKGGLAWSYDSWIYNYLCNQCLSQLMLRIRIPLMPGLLDLTLCDKVCQ